jgi:hypothetical protein
MSAETRKECEEQLSQSSHLVVNEIMYNRKLLIEVVPSSPVNVYYFSAIEKKIKVLLGIVPNPASNCGKICIYWCNYTPFKRVQNWSVPRLQFHFGKIPPEKIGSRSGFEPVTVPDMDINTSIRLGESETRLSQNFACSWKYQ